MTPTAVVRCSVRGCPFATTLPAKAPWYCPPHQQERNILRHLPEDIPPPPHEEDTTP